jgi:predicted 3-demethylubiquinone-9 3-methyltransferase (glyoxalase superfamily)
MATQAKTRSITPCLTFQDRAEEAVNFYVSVFENSRILSIVRSEADGPIPKGKLLHASFELDGREYTAFDGGPPFSFSIGFSLVATCETQEELDRVWEKLCAGGEPGPCGWLKDKFSVSWQVVPAALGKMMSNPKGGNTAKVMQALMKMGKLDIKTLEEAYRQR